MIGHKVSMTCRRSESQCGSGLSRGSPVAHQPVSARPFTWPCVAPASTPVRLPTTRTMCLKSETISNLDTTSPRAPAVQHGLVFGLGELGSWDEAAVGSPVVRCYVGDNEERWLMWYSGRQHGSPAAAGVDVVAPSSGSIGVAISSDGIHWQRGYDAIEGSRGADAASDVGRTIAPNGDWWTFDTCHLAPGDVQVLSNSSVSSGVGVYWMFYSGGDFEAVAPPEGMPGAEEARRRAAAAGVEGVPPGAVEGLRMRPGLAMSQDGRNWARIEADHHTGALFDVGASGEHDELHVNSTQVLAVGPRDMRMYYTCWEPRLLRYVVSMAVSPDGFKWTKKGVVFDPAAAAGGQADAHDALGAASISVVRDVDNRQYLMMYEAVAADNRRSVGMAVSKDGTSWKRYGRPVLLPAAAEAEAAGGVSWDGGDVGSPCAVSMSAGKWRLYYCGRKERGPGPWQGIGLALSVDGCPSFEGVPTQFRRRAPKQQQQ